MKIKLICKNESFSFFNIIYYLILKNKTILKLLINKLYSYFLVPILNLSVSIELSAVGKLSFSNSSFPTVFLSSIL